MSHSTDMLGYDYGTTGFGNPLMGSGPNEVLCTASYFLEIPTPTTRSEVEGSIQGSCSVDSTYYFYPSSTMSSGLLLSTADIPGLA